MITWKVQRQPGSMLVTFEGEVTEQADFRPLIAEITVERVTFDLAGIERFNSMGVKGWLDFVNALKAKGVSIIYDRCSVAVVAQINMVAGFEASGVCKSVFAPYYCESCNREDHVLVEMTPNLLDSIPPTMTCKKCRGEMAFDDLPESYAKLVDVFCR